MDNVDLMPKKATYIGWPNLPRTVALCLCWGVVYVFSMLGIAKYKTVGAFNFFNYTHRVHAISVCFF